MTFEQGKYNMKAVTKLLGIQSGTLRAWERRYKIIAPVRNEAGHRLYTEKHVEILRWLVSKVQEGYTISQAVALYEENEEQINRKGQPEISPFDQSFHHNKSQLLQALLKFEEERARKIFSYTISLFSIEWGVIELITSIFTEMKMLKEQHKISSAHEQFIYNFMRTKVGAILQNMPCDSVLPKAILVSGPNEAHELGLLLFTLFLKWKGYHVIYLGTSVHGEDLLSMLNEINPEFLFISFTMVNVESTSQMIEKITTNHPEIHLGIGGKAVPSLIRQLKKGYQQYLIGPTKTEWEKWLGKWAIQ
ncbi:MerR family transcriptional regulator [Schinkia sp. CFF1]